MKPLIVLLLVCSCALFSAQAADAPAAEGAKQTTASGLTIITVKTSTEAMAAQKDDLVWVHYTGKLADGKTFDSSFSHPRNSSGEFDPISFRLGQAKVIKGWDEGIVGMKVGDKRQLIIPPALAYGAQGAGADIPPNATLTFDVELVGIYRESK